MLSLATAYNIEDLRLQAQRKLPRGLFEFIDRGAEDEILLKGNRTAFERIKLISRSLEGHKAFDLRTTLFGREYDMPLAIAPTGIVGLVWFQGEIAAARAAHQAGVPYSLSTASIMSLETVASHATEGDLWFQLYVFNRDDLTFALVQRAKDAGYSALIVTTDGLGGANREYNLRNQFTVPMRITPKATWDVLKRPGWIKDVMLPSLRANGIPSFANYPEEFRSDVLGRSKGQGMAALGNPIVSRDLLKRLRDKWDGPMIVKGILDPRDAVDAVKCGADGIIVSNHGGRTLDSAIPAIAALPAIAEAVGAKAEVLIDSGFRRGSDVVKALALGAKAVMLGRAPIWGTAAAGTAGAVHALTIFQTEMRRIMAQTGCASISDIGPECLWNDAGSNTLPAAKSPAR